MDVRWWLSDLRGIKRSRIESPRWRCIVVLWKMKVISQLDIFVCFFWSVGASCRILVVAIGLVTMVLFSPFASFEVFKINQKPKKKTGPCLLHQRHMACADLPPFLVTAGFFRKQKIQPFRVSPSSLAARNIETEMLLHLGPWVSVAKKHVTSPCQSPVVRLLGWWEPSNASDWWLRMYDNTIKYIVVIWYDMIYCKPFSTPNTYFNM